MMYYCEICGVVVVYVVEVMEGNGLWVVKFLIECWVFGIVIVDIDGVKVICLLYFSGEIVYSQLKVVILFVYW